MKVKELTLVNHGFNQYSLYFEIEEDVRKLIQGKAKKHRKDVDDGFLFCDVFSNGLALYGYTIYKDPIHGNKEYTWSSRAEVMNEAFGLNLNKSDIGIKTYNPDRYECYYSVAIDRQVLRKLVKQAIDKGVIRIAKSTCSPVELELDINSVDSILTNQ